MARLRSASAELFVNQCVKFAFQCGKLDVGQGIVGKGKHQQGPRFGLGNSAGAQVKQGVGIQLAHGAPVGALDVVGKNLQLRLGVYLRTVVQKQVCLLYTSDAADE